MKSLFKLILGKHLFYLITSVVSISACFAQEDKIMDYSKWSILSPGLEYIEELAPLKSKIGDFLFSSNISLLRLYMKLGTKNKPIISPRHSKRIEYVSKSESKSAFFINISSEK